MLHMELLSKDVLKKNLINPDTSIHIGVRGSINDINDYKNDAEMGFKTIFCSEIDEIGVNGIIEKIKNVLMIHYVIYLYRY